jgi:hypothetical protein
MKEITQIFYFADAPLAIGGCMKQVSPPAGMKNIILLNLVIDREKSTS